MNLSISGHGPSIVFIHGYCETLDIWKPYHAALSSQFQVVSVDLPGHGKSPIPVGAFSIDDVATEVLDALKGHGIETFFPIGHSLGGYIALSLLEQYSVHVSGIGIFSSTSFPDDNDKKKARDKVKGFLDEHGVDSFIDSFVPSLFTPENRKKLQKEITKIKTEGKKISADVIHGYAQAMKHRPDRTHLLVNDEKPIFIIAGDRDMAVKLEASKKMIQKIQKGDSIILKDVGHNGFIEAEMKSIAFITEFLDKFLES